MRMDDHAAYKNLEDRIGYRFHDAVILESALASRASHAGNPAQTMACTVPLAAVGDAVIDAVVACRLYEEWQDSGPVPPGDTVQAIVCAGLPACEARLASADSRIDRKSVV